MRSKVLNPKYLWRWDVEELLGVSANQVANYRKQGLLRAIQYKPKGHFRYLREDVEKMLQRQG